MNCEQALRGELAQQYVSGELDGDVRDEFEVHFLQCPRCLESVESVHEITCAIEAQAGDIRLLPAKRPFVLRFKWIPIAAMLCVACGLGVWVLNRSGTRRDNAAAPRFPAPVATQTETGGATGARQQARPSSQQQLAGARASSRDRVLDNTATPSRESNPGLSARTMPPGPSAAPPAAMQPESVVEAPPTSARKSQPEPVLSDATAAELFRLGTVNPPPYTLSPVTGGRPSAHTAKGYSEVAGASGSRDVFQRAMAAYVERRYDRAADLLQQSVQKGHEDADASFYLGVCELVLGRPASAIESLKTASVKPSPLLQSALLYLGKAYIQTGKYAEAEDALRRASATPSRHSSESKSVLKRLQAIRPELEGHKHP